jgi:AraC-like DNA-binding protein
MVTNIRGTLVLDLANFIRHLGHDPDQVFADAGYPMAALGRDTRVPVEAPMTLRETASRRFDMPDFGLQLAAFRKMPDLGPVALFLRAEQTLGGVLATIAQAFHLHSTALYLSIVDAGTEKILAVDLLTSGRMLSRQSAEMIVCGIREMFRWILGPEYRPAGILFRHAPALPSATYLTHFGVEPDFGQEYNGIVLNTADLDLPLKQHAPRVDQAARDVLANASTTPEAFLYRVRQLIVLSLAQGTARSDRIAALLEIDRRTLHRRLSRQGQSFSDLLLSVRREFARQYVLGSDRSFAEIAYLVGFESPAVFSRWYKTHMGHSPRDSRAAALRV